MRKKNNFYFGGEFGRRVDFFLDQKITAIWPIFHIMISHSLTHFIV